MRPDGTRNVVITDHLGSTRLTLSTDAAPMQSQLHNAFGEVTSDVGEGARTGYIGREHDVESDLGFYGVRLYEPEYGRFMSTDPLWGEFISLQPYHYSYNCPTQFVDITGLGPFDRATFALSLVNAEPAIHYVQEGNAPPDNLRTAKTTEALANMDCSELVCRVLEEDGLTDNVKHMNTSGLKTFFNSDDWVKSETPKVGDIFLFRNSDGGHTGVVTQVNDDGTMEIAHAKGTKAGLKQETVNVDRYKQRDGWQGFFSPTNELPVGVPGITTPKLQTNPE